MTYHSNDPALEARALAVIPKGMYGHQSLGRLPKGYPQFFSKARGTRIWDSNGKEYIDLMSAYGPNLLGYQHEEVERAADRQKANGDTMTGPGTVMVELAETLVGMITHADWLMTCKNGSDATTMALMVARAHRGKRKILLARKAYHGSVPWNTPLPAGSLPEDRKHIIYFDYNDLESLEKAAQEAGDDLAGVFATPFRHEVFADQTDLDADFARGVRAICDKYDALLIADEVRTGLRLSRDCVWDSVGASPDLSTWGKALGNGYPISALLGRESVRKAASDIYVTGSFWYSAVPMAAAVETLRIVRETDYLETMNDVGNYLRTNLDDRARKAGFELSQTGPVTMPMVRFKDDPDLEKGNRWCQLAIENGLWTSPYHNMFINAAMTRADMDIALEMAGAAFDVLQKEHG